MLCPCASSAFHDHAQVLLAAKRRYIFVCACLEHALDRKEALIQISVPNIYRIRTCRNHSVCGCPGYYCFLDIIRHNVHCNGTRLHGFRMTMRWADDIIEARNDTFRNLVELNRQIQHSFDTACVVFVGCIHHSLKLLMSHLLPARSIVIYHKLHYDSQP